MIRPTVWPQYTNVTDRTGQTDRTEKQTDNGPIPQDEPFYKQSPKSSLWATEQRWLRDDISIRLDTRASCDGHTAVVHTALCISEVSHGKKNLVLNLTV